MDKKIIIFGVGLLVVFSLILFFLFKNKNDSSKKIELTYKSTAGIPYEWKFEIEDESIVQFVKSYELKSDSKGPIDGGTVYTNYVFKGLKKGKTTITFKYISLDGDDVMEEHKNTFIVDSNLNISLSVLI